MAMFPVLILLTFVPVLLIAHKEWEPFQIGVIYDPRQFFISRRNLAELEDALLNLYGMIETRPIPLQEQFALSHKHLTKCAPETNFRNSNMFSVSKNTKIQYFNQLTLNNSSLANFFIILEFNGKECMDDWGLLAGAKPCFYDMKSDNRPSMGRMVICLNNRIWRHFQSGYDLFRHEILHALGFGMIYPQSESKKSQEPNVINWRTGQKSQQPIKVYYLDFAEKAIEFARSHFSCPKLDAIQADNAQKFHLNEYLFGNELMTPVLSNGRNYFTHLSASILESTHFGNMSWYKVNESMVNEETSGYWYARNYGCDFVEQSCYEFINNHAGVTFPFCKESDVKKKLIGQSIEICFENGTHLARIEATCKIESNRNIPTKFDEYDLKPVSLNSQYKEAFRGRNKRMYGSTKDYRYCPMISNIFDGEFDNIPRNGVPVKCPN